ncbi:MAG: glycogen debranching N-terminal domain-containing protein, partial [Halolamina sp.]
MPQAVLVAGTSVFVTRPDGRLAEQDGLYHRDTRYLSSLDVSISDGSLDRLATEDRSPARRALTFAEATEAVNGPAEMAATGRKLVLTRTQSLTESDGLAERIDLANHASTPRSTTLHVDVDADFADVFEVRDIVAGQDRNIKVRTSNDDLRYEHRFTDRAGTETRLTSTIAFDKQPAELVPGRASFEVTLAPQQSWTLHLAVVPGRGDGEAIDARDVFGRSVEGTPPISPVFEHDGPPVPTGDRAYDRSFERAAQDLAALTTATEYGPVPVAGTPWFASVFGRDALLTAYLSLPVAPALAVSSLRYLAAHQGTTDDAERDEQAGKMFHELRQGELAARGLIPHTPYYGTVDATPLWVVLLHETYRWTGDDTVVESLWEPLEGALGWIERATASIGDDPFLYYRQSDESGVVHKAWRDTTRSVQFADGQTVGDPIASVEVQGYVYDALSRAATLYRELAGDETRADELATRARALRERFDESFWLPEEGFYGAAVTADGEVVDTRTSNVGHCLWSGIVPEPRRSDVVDRLLASDLFTGWGIRTMGRTATGFDPVSYHTGSVWPHDTALVTLGLAAGGFHAASERVARGLLEASTRFDHHRLPELFCGFPDDRDPVPYPAACAPQAWAA